MKVNVLEKFKKFLMHTTVEQRLNAYKKQLQKNVIEVQLAGEVMRVYEGATRCQVVSFNEFSTVSSIKSYDISSEECLEMWNLYFDGEVPGQAERMKQLKEALRNN
ncbi:MAG TPA: hypothetical protein VFV08_14340 [Puia sp.]|nr:hypothetical protein [Puia sp.]